LRENRLSIREILQIGHPVLAARASEVDVGSIQSAEVQGWIDDMIDTMRDAKGAGIAANQIGIPYRLFTIEVGNNPRYPYKPPIPLTVVINPEIEFLSDQTFSSNEGCLSVPQIRGRVDRHVHIGVSYYDRDGERQSCEVKGYSACTWQHEHDHLDGILFPHRVTDPTTFCSWSVFQEYQQAGFSDEVRKLVEKWGA
jgi:peptide deformylase